MCYRFYLKGFSDHHMTYSCIHKYNPLRDEVISFKFILHILQAEEFVKKANESTPIEPEDYPQQPIEPSQETDHPTSVINEYSTS